MPATNLCADTGDADSPQRCTAEGRPDLRDVQLSSHARCASGPSVATPKTNTILPQHWDAMTSMLGWHGPTTDQPTRGSDYSITRCYSAPLSMLGRDELNATTDKKPSERTARAACRSARPAPLANALLSEDNTCNGTAWLTVHNIFLSRAMRTQPGAPQAGELHVGVWRATR